MRDINTGTNGSFPEDFTFCNDRMLFKAESKGVGSELWSASGSGASLVKDINTITTNSSFAGSYFFFKGIGRQKTDLFLMH